MNTDTTSTGITKRCTANGAETAASPGYRAGPGVPLAPFNPLGVRAARVGLRFLGRRMPVRFELPDGRPAIEPNPRFLEAGPGSAVATVRIHSDDFFARVASGASTGFGEAYMAGDWEVTSGDLGDVMCAFGQRFDEFPDLFASVNARTEGWQPDHEQNHRRGARQNIARHYDLSNDLFAAFLDETLAYSSAWFAQPPHRATWDDLADAQRRKIDGILDLARVGDGTRLLEIGTGWGQLAIQAAQRGARVRSITLSQEQQELARDRIQRAGMADRVQVDLCDYRDIDGTYDAAASVEMIEAVGEQFWPDYFEAVHRVLRPGGVFGLQAITTSPARVRAERGRQSWITKYIFPGGFLPSAEAIEVCSQRAGEMRIAHRRSLGQHYARTLQLWRHRFDAQRDVVAELGFDDTFCRMWALYLAWAEAGFRLSINDVEQFAIERPT